MESRNDVKESSDKLIRTTNGCLIALLGLVITISLSTFTVMYMFNNLIVPTFDLEKINFVQAFGIDLFISYLTYQKNKNEDENELKLFIQAILVIIMFLGMAWIAVQFI
ncbi:hypothetical protein ACOJIU_04265 [Carnobacterium maltaromaticum]|uniref:hypothetical protein n=1 Tax=Carnobacterium maltaromaticum TaxID=2751 RepID=UPI003B9867DF